MLHPLQSWRFESKWLEVDECNRDFATVICGPTLLWMTCSRTRRLANALVGLLAGDAALLLYLLLNAFWARATLLAAHAGEPYAQAPVAIQLFTLYAPFSLVGWLFIGVPIALLLPVRFVIRWPWPFVITLGGFLGPPAMLIILRMLGGGRIVFAGTGTLFIFSILVSTVSFAVYVALLRKQLGGSN
jgi:hypothetical protein